MKAMALLGIVAAAGSVLLTPATFAFDELPNPDFTRGETVPEGATHDWNLGPTGARGWMHSSGMETSLARQVLVTEIAEGSPADGVLAVGDVIL
ncbi:MAG: acetylesterase, partial [Phycisphaerales bacterium]